MSDKSQKHIYYAHTSENGQKQTIQEHLLEVARLACDFASDFDAREMGYLIGLLHDVGKYTAAFQKRLLENGAPVDHSTAGGQVLWSSGNSVQNLIAAYCILGHHAGLPNGGAMKSATVDDTLYGRLRKDLEKENVGDYMAYQQELALPGAGLPQMQSASGLGFSLSFFIRMLYSCLVDADFLDTERFMSNGAVQRGGYPSIATLYDRLEAELARFQNPKNELHKKRTQILHACLRRAENPPGLFTLTVPTGGGKTISSLAFALKHAKKHGKQRIIYVIPYTSIIEQNAQVFAALVGKENVLEHHSNILYDNDEKNGSGKYLSTENWDAPIVVTTNVQFFESLFAARSSACRKLHNIANSVIVMDEAQMLPIEYLRPCVNAIAQLTQNYKCTAILCTATQPALQKLLPKGINPVEICENTKELYTFFRRVTIHEEGLLLDEVLGERLKSHSQALCIVNTRKHAQALYRLLPHDGSYHLSTAMYPLHRSRVLSEIRARLNAKLACSVVSTSLVEAGVDVDFPVVYREQAGLDSIIQAAGRCNREGRHSTMESFVYVFQVEDAYRVPRSLEQPLAAYKEAARRHAEDIATPEAVQTYFSNLFLFRGAALDQKQIVEMLEAHVRSYSFPFRDIAKEFRLIENESKAVFIPIEARAQKLLAQLQAGLRSRALLREVGQYCVNLFQQDIVALSSMGIIKALDTALYVLCDLETYRDDMGLDLKAEGGKAHIM